MCRTLAQQCREHALRIRIGIQPIACLLLRARQSADAAATNTDHFPISSTTTTTTTTIVTAVATLLTAMV
jgi:hypothetical protein